MLRMDHSGEKRVRASWISLTYSLKLVVRIKFGTQPPSRSEQEQRPEMTPQKLTLKAKKAFIHMGTLEYSAGH